MDLYLNQFDPRHDFPARDAPERYYVILFTPRSGSHLLGHCLRDTGQMGFPLEYFNPVNFRQWQQRFKTTGFQDTYRLIKRFRTSPNGYFGSKFHLKFYKTFRDECTFDEVFPQVKYLYMRREDLLGQAVSLATARMTGKYISFQKGSRDAAFNYGLIREALIHLAVDDARIRYFLGKRGARHCEITYEALVRDPQGTIREIARHLEIDLQAVTPSDRASIPRKQGGERNAEFRQRFVRESQARGVEDDLKTVWDLFPESGRGYWRAAARCAAERLRGILGRSAT